MGNCQAMDENASLVIQHGGGGRVEKHYWPLCAAEIMKSNPGHYVALLLTTTIPTTATALGITRIKLLKPTDTLLLGHVYRLVTAQEVMKGLWAKRHSTMKLQSAAANNNKKLEKATSSDNSNINIIGVGVGRSDDELHKTQTPHLVKHDECRRHRCASGGGRWQPSLPSISEATAGTNSSFSSYYTGLPPFN